jgi:hypothetical protein
MRASSARIVWPTTGSGWVDTGTSAGASGTCRKRTAVTSANICRLGTTRVRRDVGMASGSLSSMMQTPSTPWGPFMGRPSWWVVPRCWCTLWL